MAFQVILPEVDFDHLVFRTLLGNEGWKARRTHFSRARQWQLAEAKIIQTPLVPEIVHHRPMRVNILQKSIVRCCEAIFDLPPSYQPRAAGNDGE